MFKHAKFVLGVLLPFGMVSQSFAIGSAFISNEVLSARSAGQGYVGVAGQNNDPMTVYTNPAAMTALKGTQVTVGATLENIHGSYQDNAGNETKERVTDVGVPNFAVTQSFLDGQFSAGLASVSPFGLETYWPSNSPLRYAATDSRLDMVDITPVVAYKVNSMVSVGAGADYVNLFNATLNQAVPTGAADGNASLTGHGDSWGYHAGVVFTPTDQHAVGLTYHSKVNLRINGNATLSGVSGTPLSLFTGISDFSTPAYTDLVLPANVQFGYAFKPTDRWLLEADAAWYHWSEAQDLDVRTPTSPLGGNTVQTLSPRDAWSFATGVNYKATDRLQVRSGFWYEPWATPESTFSPAFMDLTRYGVSVGAGYGLTDNLSVDAAYTAVFMHSRTIDNGGLAAPSGTYSDFANLFALNFTYRFGAK